MGATVNIYPVSAKREENALISVFKRKLFETVINTLIPICIQRLLFYMTDEEMSLTLSSILSVDLMRGS